MPVDEVIKNGLCYMCTYSCPSKVHVAGGRVTRIDWLEDHSTARCPRFNAQIDFVYHPDRLLHPLRRIGERGSGSYERVSWDNALDTIAENLQKVKDQYGAEAVAFWVAYTKEPRPYFHRLTHAFGSPNYCTESSSCASSAVLASYVTYGTRLISPPMAKSLSRCALVWGSSISNSKVTAWPDQVESKKKGRKLIVVDPRRNKIASLADVHLQLRPGTDGALALGMINVIISENLHDEEFIKEWTVGFSDLKELAEGYTPERVEQITRVPASKIREAAIMYASEKPAEMVLSANSTTHHSNGLQGHRAILMLPAITGNIPVPRGDGRSRAPFTNDITLHQTIGAMPPGVGSKRFPLWTKQMKEMQSNALADQIDSGDPYPIKAMFCAGLDLQFFANCKRITESLRKLDFIATADYFKSPGTRMADVVLPIASWLEREILQGLRSGHISLIEPAIEPPGECRTEWKIYSELAKRLGFGDMFWGGDFAKCVDYILEPSGITYDDLQKHPDGITITRGTKAGDNAKKAGFSTASGKIEIASSVLAAYGYESIPVYTEPAESPLSCPDVAEDFPLVLTSGARVLAYTHSQFRNIDRLRRLTPEPLVDINPVDAEPRGIKQGDTVVISSLRGSIKMKANVTDTILDGVVSVPHHWPGEANANILIDDINLDPVSGFPPFKSQLCQISKA